MQTGASSSVATDSNQRPAQSCAPKPKLLDQVRRAIRARYYSKRTERTYADWIKRFILFHGKRHRRETVVQKTMRQAVLKAGIGKPATPHVLRHGIIQKG